MTHLKKIAMILAAAMMVLSAAACGSTDTESTSEAESSVSEGAETAEASSDDDASEADADSSDADTEETTQAAIPQEYDGSEVDDDCAQLISDYFTAIMNQDYEAYRATLDDYYFSVYNDWLDGNYGYGMETSFETMHQNLLDAADAEDVVVTKLTLSPAEPSEDESDIQETIDSYLSQYDEVIGDGFSDALKEQCDDIIDVKFTMTATCDGEEKEIMTDMELLLTVTDGVYRILG
jgi:hypothetical protein